MALLVCHAPFLAARLPCGWRSLVKPTNTFLSSISKGPSSAPIRTIHTLTKKKCPNVAPVEKWIRKLEFHKRTFSGRNRLPFEVNTKIKNDVMIFSYTQDTFFKMLTIFGIVQFLFWCNIAWFAYSSASVLESPEAKKLFDENTASGKMLTMMGANKYRVTGICLFLGFAIGALAWIYPRHIIHKLSLMKGGESIKLATYNSFGSKRNLVIPLEDVNCTQSRETSKTFVPLKLKGRRFHYMMDKRDGTFHDTKLFDFVVGLKRDFGK